jgi:hypothetical protein
MKRRAAVVLAAMMLAPACSGTEDAPVAVPPPQPMPVSEPVRVPDTPEEVAPAPARPAAEPTSLAASLALMESVFDVDEAMKLLRAIDPYYRVRGNQGYQRSLERIMLILEEGGFAPGSGSGARDFAELRDLGPVEPAWTPISGSLELVSPDTRTLHAFEDESGIERTFVCVNSFATPPEGIVAPLVRYDASKPPEVFAGTVVFGRQPTGSLFSRAVQQGGALGVISGYLPDYNKPETYRDSIRYSKVPYDAERQGFGLNVSPASAESLDRLLANGLVYVKVTIASRFADARGRAAVATIDGTEPNAGSIAVVGHLDEPGANDNGSGVAAMAAMASGYLRAINDGSVPRPRRPIHFIFGTEFECSGEWLKSQTKQVDLALVIDMVGEDQALTGATALVERMPDPGAIWDRPPLDIHSEWGRTDGLRESDLSGSFLNDYMMAAMRIRAGNRGWNVRSNPYEGGSDHESFLDRGVPAVLLWHFTDTFYHTSLDRMDKVSGSEMTHMAVAALGVMHHFAQAGSERSLETLEIVMDAARRRLATEAANARTRLAIPAVSENPAQRSAVSTRERTIIQAWARWYREALLSIEQFDPAADGDRSEVIAGIDEALTELREMERAILESI